MPPGRPQNPGTPEERAAARRAQVRANVQAFRRRQRRGGSASRESEATSASPDINPEQRAEIEPFQEGLSTTNSGPSSTVAPYIPSSNTVEYSPIDETGAFWPITLPMKIEVGPAYTDAFVAAFQYRSNPHNTTSADPSGLVRVEVVCSQWVTTVSVESQTEGASMLKDAFLAAALSLLSIERNDQDMASSALTTHARSLRSLREALLQFTTTGVSLSTSILYATAVTLALAELLMNRSWENFAKHVSGVGALIQHEGPGALTTTAARSNFYGYRAIQIPFSFLNRRDSFLAKREWIYFPWRDEHPTANHHFHTLLDIVFQIPSEMEKFDSTVLKTLQVLRAQLGTLSEISAQLQQWKIRLIETSPPPVSGETVLDDELHYSAQEFLSIDIASSYVFFAGAQVALYDLMREILEEMKFQGGLEDELLRDVIEDSLKWSRRIFECIEYFLAQDRKVIGKMICLFPFDRAWGMVMTLSTNYDMDMTKELLWCQQAAIRLEETGVPLLNRRNIA